MKFEELVIGDYNDIAVRAAEMVAKSPGKHYPLLLIQGKPGSGKTVLMKAVENKAKELHCVGFYNRSEKEHEDVDILLIDDLQNLEFEKDLQEKLFQILKIRLLNNKQTIISVSKPIHQFEVISEDLELLFMEALVVELKSDLNGKDFLV